MKNTRKFLLSLALALTFGAVALSAQSCAAAGHASNAVVLSAAASGEASSAAAGSVAASVRAASAVAVVPVWMSGAAVAGSGAVVSAVGESTVQAGVATTKGAEKLWDFATGETAKRPALNRERSVPPPKPAAPKTKDPSPAEALRLKS